MRKVFLLPSLITSASMFCGLLAILNVLKVTDFEDETGNYKYVLSCWLILAAAVLDLFDGLVARLTRSESAFGAQLDSLADLVAFGVAPAILIFTRMIDLENTHLAEGSCIFFVVCGALRLARFNVQKAGIEKKSFTGLPIPAAAGMVVSSFLFFQRIDPEWQDSVIQTAIPFLMLLLAFLMVSTVSYPSFKQLRLERRKQFEVLCAIVLICAMMILYKDLLDVFVFAGFSIYIIGGIVGYLYFMVRKPGRRVRNEPQAITEEQFQKNAMDVREPELADHPHVDL